jgi:hypothetical protein
MPVVHLMSNLIHGIGIHYEGKGMQHQVPVAKSVSSIEPYCEENSNKQHHLECIKHVQRMDHFFKSHYKQYSIIDNQ